MYAFLLKEKEYHFIRGIHVAIMRSEQTINVYLKPLWERSNIDFKAYNYCLFTEKCMPFCLTEAGEFEKRA